YTSSTNFTLNVQEKILSILQVGLSNPYTYGETIAFSVWLSDNGSHPLSGQTLEVYLYEEEWYLYSVATTNATGHVTVFLYHSPLPGTISVQIFYPGTREYRSTSIFIEIQVQPRQAIFEAPIITVPYGYAFPLSLLLYDINGTTLHGINSTYSVPLPNQTVYHSTVLLSYNGTAFPSLLLPPGQYSIAFSLSDPRYSLSSTMYLNITPAEVRINNLTTIETITHTDYCMNLTLETTYGVSLSSNNLTILISNQTWQVIFETTTDGQGKICLFLPSDLNPGTYTVTLDFAGSLYYNTYCNHTTWKVNPIPLTIMDVALPAQYASQLSFTLNATYQGLGEQGIPFYCQIVEENEIIAQLNATSDLTGTIHFHVTNLPPGNYTLTVSSPGTRLHLPVTASWNFTISKSQPEINIVTETTDLYYGHFFNLTLHLTDYIETPLSGQEIQVTLYSQSYTYFDMTTSTDEVGIARVQIPVNGSLGPITLQCRYPGSENFTSTSRTLSLLIKKGIPSIQVINNGASYINLTSLFSGRITSNIGAPLANYSVIITFGPPVATTYYTVTDEQGQFSISMTPTSLGILNFTVQVFETQNYQGIQSQGAVIVQRQRLSTAMNESIVEHVRNTSLTLFIQILDMANMPVQGLTVSLQTPWTTLIFYTDIEGKLNASLHVPDTVKAGYHPFTIKSPMTAYYDELKVNFTLALYEPVRLHLCNLYAHNNTVTLSTKLIDSLNNTVPGTLKVQDRGVIIHEAVINGQTTITFPLSSFNHTLDLIMVPALPYLPSSYALTVWVPPVPKINVTLPSEVVLSDPFPLNISLLDEKGHALQNYSISITITRVSANTLINQTLLWTRLDGKASTYFQISIAGNYTITVTFVDPNAYFDSLIFTYKIEIKRLESTFSLTYEITPRYLYAWATLQAIDKPLSNQLVQWYLNDTLIQESLTDQEGQSEIQYLINQTGIFTLRIRYSGSENFQPTCRQHTVILTSTVIEANPQLRILAVFSVAAPIAFTAIQKTRKPRSLAKIPIR
ncbi:MAG: hypothetical protein ACTSW4_04890, partial [Candidatus Ranarchaeia archaeon]